MSALFHTAFSTTVMKADDRDTTRTKILEVASSLLAREGPGALTVRRIAEGAGTSTMMLYSLFGGKEGVARELFLEGFDRLRQAQERVDRDGDARQYLIDLCDAYRETALSYRTHYAVMFSNAIPNFEPDVEARNRARITLKLLEGAVDSFFEQVGSREDAEAFATILWASAHGLVSLELAGYLPSAEMAAKHYQRLVSDLLRSQGP